MRKLIIVFLTIFSCPSFSSNFLQLYHRSERLKEDVKVFESGLIRLTTSSFKKACNDNAGTYENRFSKNKTEQLFKLARQATPLKKMKNLKGIFQLHTLRERRSFLSILIIKTRNLLMKSKSRYHF